MADDLLAVSCNLECGRAQCVDDCAVRFAAFSKVFGDMTETNLHTD